RARRDRPRAGARPHACPDRSRRSAPARDDRHRERRRSGVAARARERGLRRTRGAMVEPLIRDAVIADTGELDLLLQASYATRRSFGTGLRSSIQSGSARTFVAELQGKLVGIASL